MGGHGPFRGLEAPLALRLIIDVAGSSDPASSYDRRVIVYTVGHSTRTFDEFVALVSGAGVARIVDVRAFPMSRRHPHFNYDNLVVALPEAGIDYRHMPQLGGRRAARRDHASRNGLWRVDAFRNYADYAETPQFADALDQLEAFAREMPTAFMCAEAVWWQCHRRLISDYMLVRGWRVVHVMAANKTTDAVLTPGAVVHDDGTLSYPSSQRALLE
jgi:uncharacterized protein (DUF488 family)